jgi:hypothetical protein
MSKDQIINPELYRNFAGDVQVTDYLNSPKSDKFVGIGQFKND